MKTLDDSWGGKWTQVKIDIFLKYLHAYLAIMNRRNFKLIYFDGFAGSGKIESGIEGTELLEGVALQVLSVQVPRPFNIYYLVEFKESQST